MCSLQLDAQHPDTFAPSVISLGAQQYKDMVESMKLPYRGIETTSVVGAFFWSAWDQDDETPHLRERTYSFPRRVLPAHHDAEIIFRKSDVKKKGKTRGWELMLSHDIQTGITSGYAKGTKSSDMEDCIRHLKACAGQIGHPMLLPVIIFSHDISTATDIKQRDARDWLRRLENAVSMRTEIADRESYVSDGVVDLDAVNRDLVECHSQVLWKRPKAYLSILEVMETTMRMFQDHLPASRKTAVIHKLHRSMLGRIDFYRVKLHCLDSYAHTTLQRLDIQRHAVRPSDTHHRDELMRAL